MSWRSGLLFALALVVLACSGDDAEVTRPVAVEATEGFVVLGSSADGVVKVEAPEGSSAVGVDVTITKIDIAEAAKDPLFEGVEVLAAYDVGPDGTNFAEPVTITFTLLQSDFDLSAGEFPVVGLATARDGVAYEPVDDVTLSLVDGSLFVSGQISHFSEATVAQTGWILEIESGLGRTDLEVGESFSAEVTLRVAEGGTQPSAGVQVTVLPGAEHLSGTGEAFLAESGEFLRVTITCDRAGLGGAFNVIYVHKYPSGFMLRGFLGSPHAVQCSEPPPPPTTTTTLAPLETEADRLLAEVLDLDALGAAPDPEQTLLYVKCPSDDCQREADEYEKMAELLEWDLEIVEDQGAGFCEWTDNLNRIAAVEADVVIMRTYFWGVDRTHCPGEAQPFENLMAKSGVVVGVNSSPPDPEVPYVNLIGFSSVPIADEWGMVADAIIKESGGKANILAYGHDGELGTFVGTQIRERCDGCTIVTATDLEPGPADLVANAIAALDANPGVTYVQSSADFIDADIAAWAAEQGRQLTFFADREQDYDSANFVSAADTRPRESPEMRAWLSLDAALRWFDGTDFADLDEILRYSRPMVGGVDPFPWDRLAGLPEDWRLDFLAAWGLGE